VTVGVTFRSIARSSFFDEAKAADYHRQYLELWSGSPRADAIRELISKMKD
jgi:hypothetical protein